MSDLERKTSARAQTNQLDNLRGRGYKSTRALVVQGRPVENRHGPRHCNRNESDGKPLPLRGWEGVVSRKAAQCGHAGSQETYPNDIPQRSSGV